MKAVLGYNEPLRLHYTGIVNLMHENPPQESTKSLLQLLGSAFKEVRFYFYLAALVFGVLALWAWHPSDPGWFLSKSHEWSGQYHNLLGYPGAYVGDLLLYVVGKPATWCLLYLLLYLCLYTLLRDGLRQHLAHYFLWMQARWHFWPGFILWWLSTSALDALWQWAPQVPAGAGGLWGRWLGTYLYDVLGPVPAFLLLLWLWLWGLSWCLRFSWLQVANTLGRGLFALTLRWRQRPEERRVPVSAAGVAAGAPDAPIVATHNAVPQTEESSPAVFQFPESSEVPVPDVLTMPEDDADFARPVASDDGVEALSSEGVVDETSVANIDASDPSVDTFVEPAPVAPPAPRRLFGGFSIKAMAEKARAKREETPAQAPEQDAIAVVQPEPVAPAQLKVSQTSIAMLASNLPTIDLLNPPPPVTEAISPDVVAYNSRLIEMKLQEHKASAKVVNAHAGPVITRYEIQPGTGVRGTQIVNLDKELSRALNGSRVRVVESIPGSSYMGIEVPNPSRQMVSLGEIIASTGFQSSKSPLSVVLGKDNVGKPILADLAKMPHLLVAGTTGSGKSVGINTMLLSILYKATAQEVRLILVDPKMVEFQAYNDIPHLLTPVVTDMSKAANALLWCVKEMDRRYALFSKVGVKKLADFNQKLKKALREGAPLLNPFSLTPEAPEALEPLPLIAVFIDELADLMMTADKKTIETLIVRLAQKARAAGIHLVLATQRPTTDVITGLIKANVPARMAFQVATKIDSRTILDQMGAEALLGQGDMLFLSSGVSNLQRVHGAYVSDAEIDRVVAFVKTQGQADYLEEVVEAPEPEEGHAESDLEGLDPSDAALYDAAVDVVLRSRQASVSFIQRQLRIGFNKAARLMEHMEREGVVSPPNHNKVREVLAPRPED